jgi:hypothetical protein
MTTGLKAKVVCVLTAAHRRAKPLLTATPSDAVTGDGRTAWIRARLTRFACIGLASVVAWVVCDVGTASAASARLVFHAPAQVRADALVTISGRVPHSADNLVVIQRRIHGGWRPFARGHAGRHGQFVLTAVAPAIRGTLLLRAVAFGRHGVLAISPTRRVRVLPRKGHAVVVSPHTEVLAPSTLISVPPPGQPGTLRYSGGNDVQVGQILASSVGPATPMGLLARVTSVSYRNGMTVAQTTPATLLQAIPSGSLNGILANTSSQIARAAAQNNPALTCTNSVTGTITSNVSFSAGLSLQANWSLFGGLQNASLTAHAYASASITATVSGAASCKLSPQQLFRLPSPKGMWVQVVWVGPVPVVLADYVTVDLDANASLNGSLTTGAKASFSAQAGIGWDHNNGFYPIGNFNPSFTFTKPTLSANASAAVNLTPALTVLLYGVAGPKISLKTGLAFNANIAKNPWWTLTAPIALSAGITVPLINLNSPTLTVFKHTFPIADAKGPFGVSVNVTNPGNQTGMVGTPANLQIQAGDTDGGQLSYVATGLPAGLAINRSTGAISGTPTTAGRSSVTVTATDASGPSGHASFTWTILPLTGSGAYDQAVLADNPAGFWPLDDAGGPIAVDASPYHVDGTYAASGLTYHDPGPFGPASAVTTDGTVPPAMSAAPFALVGTSAWTEEVWVKSGASLGGNLWDLLYVGGSGMGIYVGGSGEVLRAYAGGAHDFTLPYPINDGTWHQIVETYDGSNALTLYVDGQQFASAGIGQVSLGGARVEVDPSGLPGSFADVSAYPAALTGSQIQNHWNAGR